MKRDLIRGFIFSFFAIQAFATDMASIPVQTWVYHGELIGSEAVSNSPLVKIHLPANQFCSGSVIGNDLVLTAAHCLRHPGNIFISTHYTGELDQLKLFSSPVVSFLIHPKFDLTSYDGEQIKFDLAVLKLKASIPISKPRAKILPSSSHSSIEQIVDSESGYVMGYGKTKQSNPVGRASAGNAFIADAKSFVIPTTGDFVSEALNAFRNEVVVVNGEKGAQMCYGDSGGPLFLKDGNQWLQIAVNSNVIHDAQNNKTCDIGSIHVVLSASENSEFLDLVIKHLSQ